MKQAWQTQEWRDKMLPLLRKGLPGRGRVAGQPDGMRLSDYNKLKEAALEKKAKVLKAMAKSDIFEPDNNVANKAIETAVEILLLPGNNSTRLAAAKTLLEYTQRKPVASSAVTLQTAEAFLDDLAAKGEE